MSDDSSEDEAEFRGDEEEEEDGVDNDEPEQPSDSDESEGSNVGEEAEDDDEEDVPLVSLKKKRASAEKVVSYAEGDDDEDDDDDIPLAALAKRKRAAEPPAPKNSKGKTSTPAKKKAKSKAQSSAPSAPSSSSSAGTGTKKYEWSSAALYGSNCDKGMLVQRLLCRWWYAFEWPDLSALPEQPPKGYDALAGFPGVYVGTDGEHVGKIMDVRDPSTAPSFRNMVQKSSEELRDLLLTALREQKKRLVEAEGAGTDTEREIEQMIKWATKLNAAKADREAAKVLKAAGF